MRSHARKALGILSAFDLHAAAELSFDEFAALEAVARCRLPVITQDDQDIVHGFLTPRHRYAAPWPKILPSSAQTG